MGLLSSTLQETGIPRQWHEAQSLNIHRQWQKAGKPQSKRLEKATPILPAKIRISRQKKQNPKKQTSNNHKFQESQWGGKPAQKEPKFSNLTVQSSSKTSPPRRSKPKESTTNGFKQPTSFLPVKPTRTKAIAGRASNECSTEKFN